MNLLVMKFRSNDLSASTGQQIEFSDRVCSRFFGFRNDEERVSFVYKDYNGHKPTCDNRQIAGLLKKSKARGDYKIYHNPDDSHCLKEFFVEDLGLSFPKNQDDFFTLKKCPKNVYEVSFVPRDSELGRFFAFQNLTGGDTIAFDSEEGNGPDSALCAKYLKFPLPDASLLEGKNKEEIDRFLAAKLAELYKKDNTYRSAHYFGFKYHDFIKEYCNDDDLLKLVESAGVKKRGADTSSGSYMYKREIQEGQELFEIIRDESSLESIELSATKSFGESLRAPSQIIYYGVPGCGKSHTIEDEIGNLPETSKMRVVFHPDYSNADFVGQILPHIEKDDRVKYDFTPGPFAKILKKALRSKERHALVIEEINRGNAAAIFGEVFQLLDRFHNDAEDKIDALKLHSGDKAGWSKYAIFNEELAKYILDERDGYTKLEPVTKDEDGAGVQYKLESGQIFSFDGIRIPPNLSIYATMNTSDQGVFTLDNAFQRRWEMKLIPNKLNDASQQDCLIADTGVTWGAFRDAINNLIMDSAQASGLSSMEDKRLGGWFILPDKDGAISKEAFANKVLKYLWDDAFKFDRQAHFDAVTTLEELIKEFEKPDGFKVFKDGAINTLQPDSSKSEHKHEEADGYDGQDRTPEP